MGGAAMPGAFLWRAQQVLVGALGTPRPRRGLGDSLQAGPSFVRRPVTWPFAQMRGTCGEGAAPQKGLLMSLLICPCLAPRPPTE